MTKSKIICAALAAALLVPTAAAEAKRKPPLFTPGTYSGTATGGGRVDFTATKRSVRSFAFDGIKAKCSDNTDRAAGQRDAPAITVSRKTGKFTGSHEQFGFKYEVSGKLKKLKASGTVRVTYRTTATGGLDENGPISCDTGVVKWKASTYSFGTL